MKQHYLNECTSKDLFKECPRCKEPLLSEEYHEHQVDKKCPVAKPSQVAERCLLCHRDVQPNTDVAWRKHLIGPSGCSGNTRRMSGIGGSYGGRAVENSINKQKCMYVTVQQHDEAPSLYSASPHVYMSLLYVTVPYRGRQIRRRS